MATLVCAGAITFESLAGGFVHLEINELVFAWRTCQVGPPGIGGFRAWLACREMTVRRRGIGTDRLPSLGVVELARLLDVSTRTAAAAVRRLVAAGLVIWSDTAIEFPAPRGDDPIGDDLANTIGRGRGHVVIPRRILRFLAKGARPTLIATVLGVSLRCISRRRTGFGARGRLAASWIARTFGVDLRRVKQARAELVKLGWLSPESSDSWATKRWGAAWRVNLAWEEPRIVCHPEPAPDCARLPPPDLHPDPLREEENHEPAKRGPSGASLANNGKTPAPNLRNIQPEDMADIGRTMELHRQAIASGQITASEVDRVRFVSAVEHARAVGERNPCGLLARVVKEGWWHLVTQRDEDRALRRIREHGCFATPVASGQSYVAAAPTPALKPAPALVRRAPPGPDGTPSALADLLAQLVAIGRCPGLSAPIAPDRDHKAWHHGSCMPGEGVLVDANAVPDRGGGPEPQELEHRPVVSILLRPR